MSECGVCIDTSFDGCDAPKFCRYKWVKARKPHKCCECGRIIAKGETYERTSGKWYDKIEVYHTCDVCQEIRVTFCCDGWMYGSLWNDADESLFPHMTTACLNELVTAKAKADLVRRWNEWKFKEGA